MIVGADVDAVVTSAMIQTAQTETGETIQFWGRYFKDAGNTDPAQYQPAREAALLKGKNIRVLPIGRQTNHVDGSQSLGLADGKTNASAIVAGFGADVLNAMPSGLLVFLDIEGPPHQSLSSDYYTGWAAGLVQQANAAGVKLVPGVYGAEGDDTTWRQLVHAITGGAACAGTWIARPGTVGCHPLHPFNEAHVRPPHLPSSVKVLIWQGVQECHNLDFNLLNPVFEIDTLAQMVLPVPAPTS